MAASTTPIARCLALALLVACALSAKTDGIPRVPGSSSTLIPIGEPSVAKFFGPAAAALTRIGPAVPDVQFTRFADPVWDRQFMGVSRPFRLYRRRHRPIAAIRRVPDRPFGPTDRVRPDRRGRRLTHR